MRKTTPSESDIQKAFFERVRWAAKSDWRFKLVHSIANHGFHRKILGKLKAEGVTAGLPDVVVFWVREWLDDREGLLFIEFKALKGELSPEQKEMHFLLKRAGHCVIVQRSDEEAFEVVREWLTWVNN